MLCYLDKSFCSSDCINTKCSRNFSPALQAKAKKWWEGCKGEPPVAFMDFRTGCEEYKPPKTKP